MSKLKSAFPAILSGAVLLAMGTPAGAQQSVDVASLAANYNNPNSAAGSLSDGNFNTPDADGRPGAYFFALGVDAFRHADYNHAIEMYKVAASWAFKPAEYNLGVMYFKGQGIPADRARGAAWMILAAERGDRHYVAARDVMITALTNAQFAETDKIWNQLKPTYGDAVALHRAKAQWRRVSMNRTGTRVGDRSLPISVGAMGAGPATPSATSLGPGLGKSGFTAYAPMGVTGANAVDGSVAYQQMDASDDPYDPGFNQNRKGTVKVEPLQRIHKDAKKSDTDTVPLVPKGPPHGM